MPSLRAKFHVFEVSELKGLDNKTIAQRVKLHAVYGNNEENKKWAKATPTGAIEMQIDNPEAFNILRYNDDVFIDFNITSNITT